MPHESGQRYSVTVTHELVAPDGRSVAAVPWTRTVTMWALSPEDAKRKVEAWAKREFARPGFKVLANATEAKLAQ